MSSVDIMITCKKCGWTFSLQRSESCPMCKEKPEIDQGKLMEVLQEYCRRSGIFLEKSRAKAVIKEFKKQTKKLPNFKECYDLANIILKRQTSTAELGEFIDKAEVKKAKKEEKKKRKQELKEKRKKDESDLADTVFENIEADMEVKVYEPMKEGEALEGEMECPNCGKSNPPGSKFCLECGTSLE
jgi:hypothetical protein